MQLWELVITSLATDYQTDEHFSHLYAALDQQGVGELVQSGCPTLTVQVKLVLVYYVW